MSLRTKELSEASYDILNVDDGLTGTAKQIVDGDGTGSPIYLSTTKVGIGTDSPSKVLTVLSSTEGDGIAVRESDDGANAIEMLGYNTAGVFKVNVSEGNTKFFVDASDKVYSLVNVGIGNTDPEQPLDVLGSIRVRSTDANENRFLLNPNNQGGDAIFYMYNHAQDNNIKLDASSGKLWYSGGNLGIGETAPLGKLHVVTADTGGSVNANADDFIIENTATGGMTILTNNDVAGRIYFADTDSATAGQVLYDHSSTPTMKFVQESVTTMAMQAGKVGIGTTDPTSHLDVAYSSGGNLTISRIGDSNIVDGNDIGYINFKGHDDTGSNVQPATCARILAKAAGTWDNDNANDAPGALSFWTCDDGTSNGLLQRMTIDEDGKVGIGRTDPDTLLHLYSTSASKPVLKIENEQGGTNPVSIQMLRETSSPADDDAIGQIDFRSKNSADEEINYAYISTRSTDVTDGTEDGELQFYTMAGGTPTNTLTLQSGNVGIGEAAPLSTLDVVTGDSEGTPPDTGIDGVWIRNNNSGNTAYGAALHINSGTTGSSHILFGDKDVADIGKISYHNDGNKMQFVTNSSAAMTILSDQKVGIGTSAPDHDLHVEGANPRIRLESTTVANDKYDWGWDSGNDKVYFAPETNDADVEFQSKAGSSLLMIKHSGSVGIGTTEPASIFEIADANGVDLIFGDLSAAPAEETACYIGISEASYTGTNGDLVLASRTDLTTSDIILLPGSAGGVGIGTTTPDSVLTLNSSGNCFIEFQESESVRWSVGNQASDDKFVIYRNQGTAQNMMEIDDSYDKIYFNGSVGIGADDPSNRLEVTGGTGENCTLVINSVDTQNSHLKLAKAGATKWNLYNSHASSDRLVFEDADGSHGALMEQNTDDWSALSSDERMKTDLVPIPDALNKLNTLRAVNYKWKYGTEENRTKSNIGLIAQDVYKVCPEACVVPPDGAEYRVIDHPNPNNNPALVGEKKAENPWTYSNARMVPFLVKAIQELSAKVDALEGASSEAPLIENNNQQGEQDEIQKETEDEPGPGPGPGASDSGESSTPGESDNGESAPGAPEESSGATDGDTDESSDDPGSDSDGGTPDPGDEEPRLCPEGDPSSEWTKAQLKAYMDVNSIAYNSGDTKDDLISKIEGA